MWWAAPLAIAWAEASWSQSAKSASVSPNHVLWHIWLFKEVVVMVVNTYGRRYQRSSSLLRGYQPSSSLPGPLELAGILGPVSRLSLCCAREPTAASQGVHGQWRTASLLQYIR